MAEKKAKKEIEAITSDYVDPYVANLIKNGYKLVEIEGDKQWVKKQ